ncbi:MAG: DNA photolyase family protein [Myxococcota bacterium]|nr:DNA photolyase family protein [Myxococcota bacterium]
MTLRSLVWFRGKELRVEDHEPLAAAARDGDVIPVFVLDPYFFAPVRARDLPHRIQFLLESLVTLEQKLTDLGSRLLVVAGKSIDVVPRLASRWHVDRVVSQRWTEPFARERDRRIASALRVPFELFGGETLLPPETLRTGAGTPYTVFTPFARAFEARANDIGSPLRMPRRLPPLPSDVTMEDALPIPSLADLGIPSHPRLLHGGEAAGRSRLRSFLRGPIAAYAVDRDQMSIAGTSRLSADLHFGTISPRTVWNAGRGSRPFENSGRSVGMFSKQLVWREFAHSTLWDRPELLEQPFRRGFVGFPWRDDDAGWRAWTEGTTGYPVVDAAARQLYAEGFVHNRARMIAASFLAKHLMIDFRRGEAHYMKYLVDADWPNNDMGWQWSAGTGCDAQPYFRIFNPTLQGERFDPEGRYVRRWVPELANTPAKYVHRPWEAPGDVLKAAGIVLGEAYPKPCVNHSFARDRFLHIAEQRMMDRKQRSATK